MLTVATPVMVTVRCVLLLLLRAPDLARVVAEPDVLEFSDQARGLSVPVGLLPLALDVRDQGEDEEEEEEKDLERNCCCHFSTTCQSCYIGNISSKQG